jgi:hypothetical protein
MRARKGKRTFGSYGDVTAVDPIGGPLLELFTIELKRGRSHGLPCDLLDVSPSNGERPFERTLKQAIASHEQAQSHFWMIIGRRDRRIPIVYFPRLFIRRYAQKFGSASWASYRVRLNVDKRENIVERVSFVALALHDFFKRFTPDGCRRVLLLDGKLLHP